MDRQFIRENVTMVSIVLFVVVFYAIQYFKPAFLYNRNGSIREFGVGFRNKTILPVWLLSIILGILCYLMVLYSITYQRFI